MQSSFGHGWPNANRRWRHWHGTAATAPPPAGRRRLRAPPVVRRGCLLFGNPTQTCSSSSLHGGLQIIPGLVHTLRALPRRHARTHARLSAGCVLVGDVRVSGRCVAAAFIYSCVRAIPSATRPAMCGGNTNTLACCIHGLYVNYSVTNLGLRAVDFSIQYLIMYLI
jgi:hypothetical protein